MALRHIYLFQVDKYSGQRDLDAFQAYVKKMVDQKDENAEREEEKVPEQEPKKGEEVEVGWTSSYGIETYALIYFQVLKI